MDTINVIATITSKSAKILTKIIIMNIKDKIDALHIKFVELNSAGTDKACILAVYGYIRFVVEELPQVTQLLNHEKKVFGENFQKEYKILRKRVSEFFAELQQFNDQTIKSEQIRRLIDEFGKTPIQDITKKDIEMEHYIGLKGRIAIKLIDTGYMLSGKTIQNIKTKQVLSLKHILDIDKLQKFVNNVRLRREMAVWNAFDKLEQFQDIVNGLPHRNFDKTGMIQEEFNELLLGIKSDLKYLKIDDYKQHAADVHNFIIKNHSKLNDDYPQSVPVKSNLQPPVGWKLMEDNFSLMLEHRGEKAIRLAKHGKTWKTLKLIWQSYGNLITYSEIYEFENAKAYPRRNVDQISRNIRTRAYQLQNKVTPRYKEIVVIKVAKGLTLSIRN